MIAFDNKNIEPGIYDISNKEYHKGQGLSNSGISEFLKKPIHYYDKYLSPNRIIEEDSESIILGKLFHTLVLEPHLLKEEFIDCPNIDRRTKIGKQAYIEFQKEAQGKIIIEQKILDKSLKMLTSFERHPYAKKLLNNSKFEKSVYWIDEESGVLCKTRPDIWNDDFIADLKTTSSVIENDVMYSIKKYGYDRQAAMMIDGINSVTGQDHNETFINIFVQTTEPYYVALYNQHNQSLIEVGRKKYKEVLPRFKQCLETNTWPGYEEINILEILNRG